MACPLLPTRGHIHLSSIDSSFLLRVSFKLWVIEDLDWHQVQLDLPEGKNSEIVKWIIPELHITEKMENQDGGS